MFDVKRGEKVHEAILRTVAAFDAIDYAPTWSECSCWLEWSGMQGIATDAPPSALELVEARETLLRQQRLSYAFGRIGFPESLPEYITKAFERTRLFARKMHTARRIARWILRNPSVRFIALVNTTALAHARHQGDLDFFIIVKQGFTWTTRLLSAGPYRLLGKLSSSRDVPDAVCLSYIVSEKHLSLEDHMLPGDDPYFRNWFLSMLPLFDDGIGEAFWEANGAIRAMHPRAERWRISPDFALERPRIAFPYHPSFERLAKRLQMAWFPSRILDQMNRDTSVIISDDVLKFHVDDARKRLKERYEERISHM